MRTVPSLIKCTKKEKRKKKEIEEERRRRKRRGRRRRRRATTTTTTTRGEGAKEKGKWTQRERCVDHALNSDPMKLTVWPGKQTLATGQKPHARIGAAWTSSRHSCPSLHTFTTTRAAWKGQEVEASKLHPWKHHKRFGKLLGLWLISHRPNFVKGPGIKVVSGGRRVRRERALLFACFCKGERKSSPISFKPPLSVEASEGDSWEFRMSVQLPRSAASIRKSRYLLRRMSQSSQSCLLVAGKIVTGLRSFPHTPWWGRTIFLYKTKKKWRCCQFNSSRDCPESQTVDGEVALLRG